MINCIVDEVARTRFDQITVPRLATVLGEDYQIQHLLSLNGTTPRGAADRLLLSGSELSAAEDNGHDGELMALIRDFAAAGKPILGICYGHQMVARALGGKCRRAAVPEFGWKKLSTQANDLFTDLERPVMLHSHYDEVFDLPAGFDVIASTADCAVQAFQVSGRPIWGVQFHPEMDFAEGQRMLDSNLETEPLAPELYVDELESPEQADRNLQLFANFHRACRLQPCLTEA